LPVDDELQHARAGAVLEPVVVGADGAVVRFLELPGPPRVGPVLTGLMKSAGKPSLSEAVWPLCRCTEFSAEPNPR
jgi:hypothetical protein